MWLLFMADHSRYGCHYLKDILCSTDSWRGWGSEEFTLPHLLQDMGELVHINRGWVVFSYSLSKDWQEPNLNSVSNDAFSKPKTDASPAITERNSEAGDSSVKGIMDHYSSWLLHPCHVPWTRRSRAHGMGAAVNWSQGNSDCMLRSLGQMEFMPPNLDQTWKLLT